MIALGQGTARRQRKGVGLVPTSQGILAKTYASRHQSTASVFCPGFVSEAERRRRPGKSRVRSSLTPASYGLGIRPLFQRLAGRWLSAAPLRLPEHGKGTLRSPRRCGKRLHRSRRTRAVHLRRWEFAAAASGGRAARATSETYHRCQVTPPRPDGRPGKCRSFLEDQKTPTRQCNGKARQQRLAASGIEFRHPQFARSPFSHLVEQPLPIGGESGRKGVTLQRDCRSPPPSCNQTELCVSPTAVMNERPSAAMASPSSSVGPEVICSGRPSGKRCRQAWKAPPESEVKYIHSPSGDHAAKEHWPVGGPTCCPAELPSSGARRHRTRAPRSFISTRSIHLPSGEGKSDGPCRAHEAAHRDHATRPGSHRRSRSPYADADL